MTGKELINNLIENYSIDKTIMVWDNIKEDYVPLTAIAIGKYIYLYGSEQEE